ncbi:IS3 family transposase, partial [Klebsiella pneumoniae]|nr:IS3 family transposase [Klebsiella pneumoniae]HAS1883809.1 IS3 family transposase [Enterobacter hormaechei subsp. xiangfangensis]
MKKRFSDEQIISILREAEAGVVCGRGRNPTLRLWPTIFSG